jgi:hypothetical protein
MLSSLFARNYNTAIKKTVHGNDQLVNAVQGNNCCLAWKSHKTPKNTLMTTYRMQIVKAGVAYSYQWALNVHLFSHVFALYHPAGLA